MKAYGVVEMALGVGKRLMNSDTCTGLKRTRGFQEVEALRLKDNRQMKVVILSVLHESVWSIPRPSSEQGTQVTIKGGLVWTQSRSE
jgi:hypothetical protein